jgi:O-antigen/teichoic acid export membrane protein
MTELAPVARESVSAVRRESSIFGPTLLLIGGRGIAVAVTFVVPLVLARILAPDAFGTYRQLLLIFTTVYGVAQLGMAESLFYFIPSDPRRAGTYAGNAVLTLAAAGAVVAVTLTLVQSPLAAALDNPALQGLLALVGGYLALMLVSAPLEIVLVSRGRHTAASVAYALSDIGRALSMLLPALVWRRLDALFAGAILFAAVRTAAAWISCRRELGAELRADTPHLGRQLRYALPLQLAAALEIAQANFHSYVVAGRFDPATFAVYSVGCLQIPLVDLVAGSACNVMMVRMRERMAPDEPAAIMPIWRETTRKLALLLVPLLCVLGIAAHDLITVLFTDVYGASVPVFRIWLLVLLLAAVPAHGPLRVLDDTRVLALQTFAKLLLVAVFTIPFLAVFGLPGAVLVALAAMLFGKSLLLRRLAKRTGSPLSRVLPWRSYAGIVLAAAAAAVPAIAIRTMSSSSLERLVLTAGTYLVAYAAIAWCCGLLDRSDKQRLLGLARRVRPGHVAP